MNLDEYAKAHIDKFRYSNGAKISARNPLQLERNLNDDYVKFLGFAADRIPLGGGVLGMITNRMFLDSESLVGLREWFVKNFERTLVVDLHGSGEETRRVTRLAQDENVFDILQGVAVSIHVRRRPSAAGTIHPSSSREVIGNRQSKYTLLGKDLLPRDGDWKVTTPQAPDWWLDREATAVDPDYRVFTLDEVFPKFSTLIGSNRDHLVVDVDREKVLANVRAVQCFKGTNEALGERFRITLKPGWNVTEARERLKKLHNLNEYTRPCEYRPFDRRWIFFHPTLVWQTAPVCSENVVDKPNRVLISLGKNRAETTNGQWITSMLADKSVVTTRDNASGFPLYLHSCTGEPNLGPMIRLGRYPNIGRPFLVHLSEGLGIKPMGDFGLPTGVAPEDILHYVYALLQAPSYRSFHVQDLVNGFPPVPVPSSSVLFRSLARLGGELVALHLMESPKLEDFITTYTDLKNPEVGRVGWSGKTVWLDASMTNAREGHIATVPGSIGFKGVPKEVWDFHIGAYQVCHKWLSDRKSRRLSKDDLTHYQKIVVAVSETIRLMKEIDKVIKAHGGWPGAFAKNPAAETLGEDLFPVRKAAQPPADKYGK